MLALFIDSSTERFHVAVLDNGTVVYSQIKHSNKNMTDFAVAEVIKALHAARIASEELTDIYVTTGPGSFTSVRIALVIAKTIITKHRHINLWSASTLEFQLGKRKGISLINARSDSWYVALRKRSGLRIYDHIVSSDDVKKLQKENFKLPVFKDLREPGLLNDLHDRLSIFVKAADYKTVVATYIKPAYGK